MSGIIDLASCIPSIEELQRRAERRENTPASSKAVMEMAEHLKRCGYTDTNGEVYRAIVEYGASELEGLNRQGLFIKGPCGIGKSYGVACLATYFKWPVIPARHLQAAYLSAESDEQFWQIVDALNFYEEPMTIVIDDVGTEDCPVMKFGTASNVIADVLDRRYYQGFLRDGVRTIVTCNLTDEQLRKRYGVRIDDRMNEMFAFATVGGRSMRN